MKVERCLRGIQTHTSKKNYNAWLKSKMTNRQTAEHGKQHTKTKTKWHEPYFKLGSITGTRNGNQIYTYGDTSNSENRGRGCCTENRTNMLNRYCITVNLLLMASEKFTMESLKFHHLELSVNKFIFWFYVQKSPNLSDTFLIIWM